jgi:hypothetical protein
MSSFFILDQIRKNGQRRLEVAPCCFGYPIRSIFGTTYLAYLVRK